MWKVLAVPELPGLPALLPAEVRSQGKRLEGTREEQEQTANGKRPNKSGKWKSEFPKNPGKFLRR